jgi:hypothetical protein
VERLLVVWCPDLLREQEHGREARAFAQVMQAVGTFAPVVEAVRPGVCAVATRGPSRYFGGDEALARLIADAVGDVGGVGPAGSAGSAGSGAAASSPGGSRLTAGVEVADGLFAAVLAARSSAAGPVVVPPGATAAFLSPWPLATLEQPELADLLRRLGIRTLGGFAALPGRHVLARFGADGAVRHRVAGGIEGELPGFRPPPPRRNRAAGAEADRPPTRQPEFWGGAAGAEARATRALARVQELLGPEAVVTGRLQGGRGPADRARLVPWRGGRATGPGRGDSPGTPAGAPWPGQVPSPSPTVVFTPPRAAQLVDAGGRLVGVTGGGMVTATPARLSVDRGAWDDVAGWAGPWPSDERWWSARRRQARMQVVVGTGTAYLLTRERGGWWVEGAYD